MARGSNPVTSAPPSARPLLGLRLALAGVILLVVPACGGPSTSTAEPETGATEAATAAAESPESTGSSPTAITEEGFEGGDTGSLKPGGSDRDGQDDDEPPGSSR